MRRNFANAGVSLLETIIYVALLALLITGTVRLVLSSSFNFSEIGAERKIMADGELAMQAMIREIRLASAVVAGGSVFGVNPGTLALTTLDEPGGSTVVTKTFSVANSRIQRQVNGGAGEYLTSSDARVVDLVFWRSTNSYSNLISIKLTLEAGAGRSEEQATFYSSAVLRRGY